MKRAVNGPCAELLFKQRDIWVCRLGVLPYSRNTGGPEQPALDDLSRFRDVEVGGHVAERSVEAPALAVHFLPDDGNHGPVDPGGIFPAERRDRQDLEVGIDQHVVLLGMHGEIGQALGDLLQVQEAAVDGSFPRGPSSIILDSPRALNYPSS